MEDATNITPHHQWEGFNRARKYFKVYFLSQLILRDGITVDPTKLVESTQPKTTMVFSLEKPTKSDFLIWKSTIAQLTSPMYQLSPKLGYHIREPYLMVQWQTNQSRDYIVRTEEGQPPRFYLPRTLQYAIHISPDPISLATMHTYIVREH